MCGRLAESRRTHQLATGHGVSGREGQARCREGSDGGEVSHGGIVGRYANLDSAAAACHCARKGNLGRIRGVQARGKKRTHLDPRFRNRLP